MPCIIRLIVISHTPFPRVPNEMCMNKIYSFLVCNRQPLITHAFIVHIDKFDAECVSEEKGEGVAQHSGDIVIRELVCCLVQATNILIVLGGFISGMGMIE